MPATKFYHPRPQLTAVALRRFPESDRHEGTQNQVFALSDSLAIQKPSRSIKLSGTAEPRKSPTRITRSFLNRRTSRCRSPGRSLRRRLSFPNIFTANKTPLNAKPPFASLFIASAGPLLIGESPTDT